MAMASVLVFDQALANTGWAMIWAHHSVGLQVYGTGLFKTESKKGHKGSLERATWLYGQYRSLIESWQGTFNGLYVACELPNVGASYRPESSLMAATALHIAALECNTTVDLVGAQTMKKHMTGNARASKQEVKAAVIERLDLEGHRKNEHIYDALGLGVTSLERKYGNPKK